MVIIGQRYNRLRVLDRANCRGRSGKWYRCQCNCGTLTEARADHLTSGRMKSCGCFNDEIRRSPKKHGMSHHKLYKVWSAMKERCCSSKNKSYYMYGARGISVCDRWKEFSNFVADMGIPAPGLTLDRIDNDGNYEPGNCRWATLQQQGNNTRRTIYLTVDGETRTLNEWAQRIGIQPKTMRHRFIAGWSPKRMLLPLRSKRSVTTDGHR